jgi:hypothetical protein
MVEWQDAVNGTFEMFAGLLIWLNVWRAFKDKHVAGVSWFVQLVFTSWGVWNLYYYPYLGQIASLFGGIVLVAGNATWVSLLIYYTRNPGGSYR